MGSQQRLMTLTLAATLAIGTIAHAAPLDPEFVTRLTRLTEEGVKREAPLTIRLQAGAVSPFGEQQAVVRVTPLVNGVRLRVKILAEDGLRIPRGQTEFEVGAPQARGEQSFPVVLDSTGSGERRLIVRVQLLLPDGREQSAVALWAAERRERPLEENHPGSRIVRGPDGREVLEIPSK